MNLTEVQAILGTGLTPTELLYYKDQTKKLDDLYGHLPLCHKSQKNYKKIKYRPVWITGTIVHPNWISPCTYETACDLVRMLSKAGRTAWIEEA